MATSPLGLKVLYSKKDENVRIGCIINEMPQLKYNILVDDVLECVFERFTDEGKPVIAIFPYKLHTYFTR